MSAVHKCPTCTCVPRTTAPRARCESCMDADQNWDATHCYSCGLGVCRGAACSALVRYRRARNRWVRMCRNCIADRHRWDELSAFSPWAASILEEDEGIHPGRLLIIAGKGTDR